MPVHDLSQSETYRRFVNGNSCLLPRAIVRCEEIKLVVPCNRVVRLLAIDRNRQIRSRLSKPGAQ